MRQHIIFQRIEAFTLFIISTYFYFDLGFSLVAYLLLLLVFDVFMVGYIKNAKVGAYIYNLGHSLIFPLVILLIAWATNSEAAMGLSLIWMAHIGLDRFLGYGLKLASGFKETHLGKIGKS